MGFLTKTPNGIEKEVTSFDWRRLFPIRGVALASRFNSSKFLQEKSVSQLTENMVYYSKLSINDWNGLQDRYRVNHSIKFTTNDKMLNYVWHFTREKRELRGSLVGQEDEHWEGFDWAEQLWRSFRSEYKHGVNLWVAKACHSKKYKAGKIQPNIRVPKTVSLLVYVPEKDSLIQFLKMEDWETNFEFFNSENQRYNKIATWRNPTVSIKGGTAPGGW